MKVAIVGFGMMGRQIAQVFAQKGHEVAATDENRESLPAGVEEIERGQYGLLAAVSRGKLTREEASKALKSITTTPDLADACRDAELIIEAVFEDLHLKQEIFERIESTASRAAILASNTSTISIARITEHVVRKERALGMHFFNPAQATKLVEIIASDSTSLDTLDKAVRIARQIGKTPVVSRDEPGFIANRLGLILYMEASRLLEEKVAGVSDIDVAMKLGYGHPMGPFETADLVGLDTRLRNLESLYTATGDTRWIPPKALREMVNQGYTGDASKKKGSKGGYYQFFNANPP